MIAYLNGEYQEKDSIRISPDDRGFLFGDGIYEVVRFYEGKPMFLKEHQHRLENGAKALRFNRTTFSELSEVAFSLLTKNNLISVDSAIVYFQVTRGVAPRSHSFPSSDTPLTIYSFAREFKGNVKDLKNGANAITVPDNRWANCDIKSISLLPNTLAHQQARDKYAIEALFIRDGVVLEGTHSNIFMASEGKVITPPLSNHILPGITRKAVLELCSKLSIPSIEKPILKDDLHNSDEVFIVGTTLEITPIIQVDEYEIGDHSPGSICQQLQEAFWELIPS